MSDLVSIKASIRRLISNVAPEADTSTLAPDEDMRDELDLDSMDFMFLLEAIDKELGVNIPESDYNQVSTLQDMAEYIVGHH